MDSETSVWDEILRLARDCWELELEELFATYDGAIKLEGESLSMWSAELRLVLTNPRGEPSRSMTFYGAGGEDSDDVARRVLNDARRWLKESGLTPMAPPDVG
jgi:hypothetical protein